MNVIDLTTGADFTSPTIRYVPMTERQAQVVEEQGKRLVREGEQDAGIALLALYLGWRSTP